MHSVGCLPARFVIILGGDYVGCFNTCFIGLGV
nr:MAG TPA: hypothetical protein [Inoviridae sp.]